MLEWERELKKSLNGDNDKINAYGKRLIQGRRQGVCLVVYCVTSP